MKRPLSVTLIAILFIVAGTAGIVYHASEWMEAALRLDTLWALAVRMTAIVAGIFALKGSNLARVILVGWILYHVGLSFYHTTAELLTHIVVAIVVLVALFNPKANEYFKKSR